MNAGNQMQDWLHAEPEGEPPELAALTKSYYERAEAYDRTVCTGPITRDGIMPMNHNEAALINRNAVALLRELQEQAARLGYSKEQFRAAMKRAGR